MRLVLNPEPDSWDALCSRPSLDTSSLTHLAGEVFETVRQEGDNALRMYTEKFDEAILETIRVDEQHVLAAGDQLENSLKSSIKLAAENIRTFHEQQREEPVRVETMPGVVCWRESRAIERVGLYIPGGTAPLFSTVLMLAIPAQIAGCREIILCSPPDKHGNIHPAILFAAQLSGVTMICKLGGMQAIAALALGTDSVPGVHKIFGPGNQYVTAAKQYAQSMGIAIDLPAGPSELLVLADEHANPDYIAADLLSQAEHGTDSQVVLVSTSESLVSRVERSVIVQLKDLPRREIAEKALENSLMVSFDQPDTCIAFSNHYAPEHLILHYADPAPVAGKINQAGSVFMGYYSPESVGDYASGTNHTLPTNGFATAYSGVSLDSFVKKITFQELSREGLQKLGPAVEEMAAAEQLEAHKRAVSIRLSDIA